MESGEKRERKSKKMWKVKAENGMGDEAGEQKKKRRGKLRKEGGGGVDQALFSNDEDEQPSKKVGSRPFSTLLQLTHLDSAPPKSVRLGTRAMTRVLFLVKNHCKLSTSYCMLTRTNGYLCLSLTKVKRCFPILKKRCHDRIPIVLCYCATDVKNCIHYTNFHALSQKVQQDNVLHSMQYSVMNSW
jgi:hypothetical protein